MALINERQAEFLIEQGQAAGAEAFRKAELGVQWFEPYFDTDISVLTEGGIDTYSYMAYWNEYIPWLTEQLEAACDDRELYQKLYQQGLLPPHVGTYLCEPPEWMDNWQAEQAFREGYHDAYDSEVMEEIERRVNSLRNRRAGIATIKEVADEVREVDTYAAAVLDDLIEQAEGSGSWGTMSLDDVVASMATAREGAYRSFAPGEPPKGRSGFEFLGVKQRVYRFTIEELSGPDRGSVWDAEARGDDFDEALQSFFHDEAAEYADYLAESREPYPPDFQDWLRDWKDLLVEPVD